MNIQHILIATFSIILFSCGNSSKYNQEEEASTETSEVKKDSVALEIRNEAISLKDTLNNTIVKIDSFMVDRNVSDSSEFHSFRNQLVEVTSTLDTVIYYTYNIEEANWESMKNQLDQANSFLTKSASILQK